jgi:site-specific recombinase XerD
LQERELKNPASEFITVQSKVSSSGRRMSGFSLMTINTVTETVIENYLDYKLKKNSWSNRHYNNELNRLKTIFIFLKKKGMININPCDFIRKEMLL